MLQFKTNIKCGGCEATVTPFLNDAVGAGNWEVNTQVPDKVLTIKSDEVGPDAVINALKSAGYTGEALTSE